MKYLLAIILLAFASCMTPSRVVERFETDSLGRTTKFVTKYYDSVRYVYEPCPPNVYPYRPFYGPFWRPRVVVVANQRVAPRRAPVRRQHR